VPFLDVATFHSEIEIVSQRTATGDTSAASSGLRDRRDIALPAGLAQSLNVMIVSVHGGPWQASLPKISGDMIEMDSSSASLASAERCLAHLQRLTPQVVTVQLDQIEGVQKDAGVVPPVADVVEARHAIAVAGDGLTIDDAGACAQPSQGVNNQREAMREVVARAAIEPHAVAILVNDPEPSYAAREKIGNSEGARFGLCKHRKRTYASHGSIRLGFPTMLRSVIALSAVVVALSTAQAAEPETLTLTCQGTVTGMAGMEGKSEPISIGVIVNFTARTVQGFGYPAEVTAVDDAVITFNRPDSPGIDGMIDRVTGLLRATSVLHSKNDQVLLTQSYMLKCTPSQRMF